MIPEADIRTLEFILQLVTGQKMILSILAGETDSSL